jgi:DNA-binding transcriptional regulator GbsR (MarR family)
MDMASSRQTAAENFIEQMGLMMQADGGPRIAGRIFGLLLIEGRPMSLLEMADSLGVSRASISTNARLLERSELIRLVTVPGNRQDYYEMVPSPFQRMLVSVGTKMRRVAGQIAEAELLFRHDDPAKARIRELADQHRQSAAFIEKWAASLLPHSKAARKPRTERG